MNIKFAAALAALGLTATLALPGEAQAGRRGWGWGPGFVAPVYGEPVYVEPVYVEPVYLVRHYRTCKVVPQFNAWGNYVGKARVCRHYE